MAGKAQAYKERQQAIDPDRKPRQTWCNKEEHQFCRKALFAYRECEPIKNAMEKLLIEMRGKL